MHGGSAPRLRQSLRGTVRVQLRELSQPVPEADHLQPVPPFMLRRCGQRVPEVKGSLCFGRDVQRRREWGSSNDGVGGCVKNFAAAGVEK